LLDSVRAARFAGYEAYANRDKKNVDEVSLLQAEGGDIPVYIKTVVVDPHPGQPGAIVVENLTLMTPDKQRRVLFEDLSLRLEHGERMLIVGPSGTGKSSFLRALSGLWSSGTGSIQRPTFRSMFFLPQKPYCTLGSLREQLVYPKKVSTAKKTDEELQEALDKVDLSLLPERMGGFDVIRSWSTVLSLGEQQRLAFARVLIGKPAMVVCDESSSALDLDAERRVYTELRNSGTAYISVGHRPSLVRYHDVLLRLGSSGEPCSVTTITPDMFDVPL
jgi:vitamin B12/bleomycin/antimicrobial peptide transport system ATP-binding/permease protein